MGSILRSFSSTNLTNVCVHKMCNVWRICLFEVNGQFEKLFYALRVGRKKIFYINYKKIIISQKHFFSVKFIYFHTSIYLNYSILVKIHIMKRKLGYKRLYQIENKNVFDLEKLIGIFQVTKQTVKNKSWHVSFFRKTS